MLKLELLGILRTMTLVTMSQQNFINMMPSISVLDSRQTLQGKINRLTNNRIEHYMEKMKFLRSMST